MKKITQLLDVVNPVNFLKKKVKQSLQKLKSPKIIWGYHNPTGEFRSKTRISDTTFYNHPEKVFISDNVFIGHYVVLDGTGGLEIGEGTQIAGWNGLYTHSSHIAIRLYGKHYNEVPEYQKKGYKIAPIKVGKYVFIGVGAKIFPGVAIGDGAFVRAGAVVNSDVEPFSIVDGNPAKVIGDTRTLDEKYLTINPELREWYSEWQSE